MSSTHNSTSAQGGFNSLPEPILREIADLLSSPQAELLLDEHVRHGDVDAACDLLADAVADAKANGGHVDLKEILAALPMNERVFDLVKRQLAAAIEGGEVRRYVLKKVTIRSLEAVDAAKGYMTWARWKADVAEDLVPYAMLFDVGIAAKHLARKSSEIIGVDLSSEDAAWTAVEGLKAAGFPASRCAYVDALQSAQSGILERDKLRERVALESERRQAAIDALFEGAA